jgi:hypothetical protein
MAFLLWVRACRGGDGRSGVTSLRRGGILLRWWGGILAGQGGVLLQWGVGYGGSSVRILVDNTSKHVLHLLQRILKYGCCVFRFDYGSGWRQCTEGRWDSEDSRDAGLCNGAD